MSKCNTIPPITDPLGRGWRQPPTADILIDDTHAMMEMHTFKALAEYSASMPSGVYPGKMWKYDSAAYGREPLAEGRWVLRWYGECPDPNMCSNHHRHIILLVEVGALEREAQLNCAGCWDSKCIHTCKTI